MPEYFLDTNILTRFLLGDVAEQSQAVAKLFLKAKRLEVKLITLPEVLIELNYALKTHYGLEKEVIMDQIESILDFTFIECIGKATFKKTIKRYKNNNISLEDAYYISFCLENNLEFYSFDKKALKIFKQENAA
jgi:predicted nucleic-acid-binding protein